LQCALFDLGLKAAPSLRPQRPKCPQGSPAALYVEKAAY
jgi:hypothetical protein